MTHDELLAKIKEYEKASRGRGDTLIFLTINALRAVVELTDVVLDTEPWQDDKDYNLGYLAAMYDVFKAIKKELK